MGEASGGAAAGREGPGREIVLEVNGEARSVWAGATTTLLEVLRDRLELTGTKEACGRGECGACTVLIDDRPELACITLALRARDRSIRTIEGLVAETAALRAAFADHGAFQCGFCTPGQIVAAVSLLRRGEALDEAEVRAGLSGNICRCTGYSGIVEAVMSLGGRA